MVKVVPTWASDNTQINLPNGMSNPVNVNQMAQGFTWGLPNSKVPGTVFYDTNTNSLKMIDNNGNIVNFNGDEPDYSEQNLQLFKQLPPKTRDDVIDFITNVKPILEQMKGTDSHFQFMAPERCHQLYWFLRSKGLKDEEMIRAHADASITEIIDE